MTNANTETTNVTIKVLNAEIKENARKFGYKFVRMTICPNCAEQIAKVEKDNNCILPWANPVCAMLFSKKGEQNIVRCSCGHKHVVELPKKKEIRYCPVCAKMGIKSKLPDGMEICYNPKHQGTKGIIPDEQASAKNTTKPEPKSKDIDTVESRAAEEEANAIAARAQGGIEVPWEEHCKCGKPLPEGRTTYCYDCVPKTRKAANKETKQEPAQEVHM